MSDADEVYELKKALAAVQLKLEKLEDRTIRGGLPGWRIGLISAGSIFGILAYFGPMFGLGPTHFDAFYVDAHEVSTVRMVFEDLDDEREYFGEIEGRDSRIDLRSDEGEVKISPRGIFISGPDGEIELKPEKSK